MWYDEAENYIEYATIALAAIVWLASLKYKRLRSLVLAVIALGVGAYFGIQTTATGTFKLPLGPMQKQMHEVWGIPAKNLQPPDDDESPQSK